MWSGLRQIADAHVKSIAGTKSSEIVQDSEHKDATRYRHARSEELSSSEIVSTPRV
jgi:hypothetical protein